MQSINKKRKRKKKITNQKQSVEKIPKIKLDGMCSWWWEQRGKNVVWFGIVFFFEPFFFDQYSAQKKHNISSTISVFLLRTGNKVRESEPKDKHVKI